MAISTVHSRHEGRAARPRNPARRLLPAALALALAGAGCATLVKPLRRGGAHALVLDAGPERVWDAAVLNAQQLSYSLREADQERGTLTLANALPGRRVEECAAASSRFFGMLWQGLDVRMTIRVESITPPSFGDRAQGQTRVLARATLVAEGQAISPRRGGGGYVQAPLASNGTLERQFLEALALEVQARRVSEGR